MAAKFADRLLTAEGVKASFAMVLIGSTVTVHLSRGPEPIQVPAIVGIPLAEAETRLAELDLTIARGEERFDADAPTGQVLAVSPEPGTTLTRGSEVSLVVNSGLTVPDVEGMSEADATAALNAAGVKLYTYTPGFVHAKSFVADDTEAVVGTINLDYRSLYHHFECAVYMHGVEAIADIEQDFLDTQSQCRRVTRESIRAEKWHVKLTGFVLKTIAPLL